MSITKKYKKSKTTKTNKKKQTIYKSNLKYCCLDSKVNKTKHSQCIPINTDITISSSSKYAITTLLFGGDSYLPGVLLLGSSIRKLMPKPYEKYITLCCMVTHDVSQEARELISKIYDRVIDVDYLQIPPSLIKHKNPHTQNTYSKTFTKLRIFEMTDYDKVLFMDSDMLVLKKDFFSLFNLNTPAAVFLGKLSNNPQDRYFKEFKENGNLFKQFQNKYCDWQGKGKDLHGNLIPYNKKYENEQISNGMNIETSVLLIKPSKYMMNEVNKYVEDIKQKQIKMSGDTEMISRLFKDKLYAIEPRFFGRWVNPEEHPELVVLDLYGSDGKPWDTSKFKELIKYIEVGDVSYWWNMYSDVYKAIYSKWNNKMLDTLYESIVNTAELDNIYKTNINIDIGNYLSNYFYYLGLSLLEKKDFKFKVDNVEFIKHLPSFINYKNNTYYNHTTLYNKLKQNGITLDFFKKITLPETMWFMYNNLYYKFWLCMKDIVYTILDNAFIKSNLKKTVDTPVIHFRCSDTPYVKHTHYHFQKYEFYKEVLDKISMSQKSNNTNTNTNTNTKTNKIKIKLLSCSFHRSDDAIKKSCEIYTKSLCDYLNSINYEPIVECNKNIEDFATLFYAPAVISIGSSFSFMSGFFGKGLFYSGGHIEENDKKTGCTLCDKWLITKYEIKHSMIDDYHDTEKVISILKS
jgi:alpha-N-acetylglucosamine transferase